MTPRKNASYFDREPGWDAAAIPDYEAEYGLLPIMAELENS